MVEILRQTPHFDSGGNARDNTPGRIVSIKHILLNSLVLYYQVIFIINCLIRLSVRPRFILLFSLYLELLYLYSFFLCPLAWPGSTETTADRVYFLFVCPRITVAWDANSFFFFFFFSLLSFNQN